MGGRRVMWPIKGLADVFERTAWEAKLFGGMMRDDRAVLGLIEAWPRYLEVYEGWPSCSGTYERLDRGVWRYIWRMAKQFWDKWKAWPMCLKGLEGRSSCSGTYQRLGQRVWRDWIRERAVLGLMEGLADEFEGDWMRARRVLWLMEGLADVFEGVGWEADVLWEVELFWDLWRAWPTCLKGLDGRPTCYVTYQRLGRRVWKDCMRSQAVLGLMEGLADEFEGIGWEPDVFWDLWRTWPTYLKGLDGRPTCYETYAGLGRCVWKGWMGSRRVLTRSVHFFSTAVTVYSFLLTRF